MPPRPGEELGRDLRGADLKRGLGYINNSVIGRIVNDTFPTTNPDTAILPATQRHDIVVGRGSLIAYTVMSGSTWLVCLLVLLSGATSSRVREAKNTTSLPILDSVAKTQVQYEHGTLFSREKSSNLNSPEAQILAVEEMKVTLATP